VVVFQLKKFHSKVIFEEQFCFLEGYLIHDAMGTTQETFHTIKQKKIPVTIMELDLSKAYDKASWLYL
jgi:hypothetical protein